MRVVRSPGAVRSGVLLLVFLAAGCASSRKPEPPVVVVARVDGHPITAAELQDEMQRQHILPASPLEDQHYRSQAIDTLVMNLAVRLEAEALDLSRDHALQKELRQTLIQNATKAYAREVLVPRVLATAEDVDRYWREHPEQFTVPKTIVDAQQILLRADLTDPGFKQFPAEYAGWTAEPMIADLYRRLIAGEDFDTLALHYSQDIFSRAHGGRLGWRYYDSTRVTPWMDSLFAFPVGEIMPPFFSKDEYFIVRINGRREPGEVIVPDTTMREQIARAITQERLNETTKRFLDSLGAAGKLEVFDSTLAIPIPELPPDLPMAVTNGYDTIFAGEFAMLSAFYPAADGSRNLSLADKRRLLDEMHRNRLVWKAMADLGYLDRPELLKARQEFLLNAAEGRIRAGAVELRYVPSDEEIQQYYENHADEFGARCPVHVQHILVNNLDTAWAIKKRIDAGADFAELARMYYRGDPEMRDVTYDLGFIAREDMPSNFFAAALRLQPGEVSDPLETNWGVHLIRVVARDQGKPLAEVRVTIADRLKKRHQIEAFARWRQNLMARHQAVIDGQALETVPILPARHGEPVDTTAAPQP